MEIREIIGKLNIVEFLDPEAVQRIGSECLEDFNKDVAARDEKDRRLKEAEKIARQAIEAKTFPFNNASNVKYPLITKAVIEFNSRVSPLIMNNGEAVKIKTLGGDNELVTDAGGEFEISRDSGVFATVQEQKNSRARKVADVMNWIIGEKSCWEEEKDRLTLVYALSGFAATKNYFDYGTSLPKSELVLPLCLYWEEGKTFAKAARKSHLVSISPNELVENMRMGIFSDNEELAERCRNEDKVELVESHTLLDLDEDGYKEPYIVVFTRSEGEVLRIVPRFGRSDVYYNALGEIARIRPQEYFVFYEFMPCLDGAVYPLGLCDLLLFINESINTNINQLIDAGTLANIPGGFISGMAKIRGGQQAFALGEFKYIDNAGIDISNAIVPLPSKEPSQTLFNLLGVLVDTGKDVAMLSDVLTGDVNPNVQPTTVLALVEQGLSGFKAILKRLQRSLKKEFALIYRMIYEHFDEIKSFYAGAVVLEDVDFGDFRDDYMVIPVSDEYYSTSLEKAKRAEFFLALAVSDNPFVNKEEATARGLQILGIDNYQDLMVKPQPAQPDPLMIGQVQLLQAQIQRLSVQNQIDLIKTTLEKMRTDNEVVNDSVKTQSETIKRSAEAVSALATAESKQVGENNPEYIRQAQIMGQFANNQAKENIEYGEANGALNQGDPQGL